LKRQDLHGILLKGNLIIFFHMLAKWEQKPLMG
jgi:hypothetical protein